MRRSGICRIMTGNVLIIKKSNKMIIEINYVVPTGVSFTGETIEGMDYIGTFQLDDGNLVFHLWIEKP